MTLVVRKLSGKDNDVAEPVTESLNSLPADARSSSAIFSTLRSKGDCDPS